MKEGIKKKRKRKYIPKRKKTGPKEPTKWGELTIKKLREAFLMGCNVVEACLYAGITTATFYIYCPRDSELFCKFMELRENPVLVARATIYRSIKGNADDAKWYLKNKRHDEFSEKNITDIQSKGEPIEGFNFVIKKDNEADNRSDD